MSIILGLIIFSILVLFHEFGHFLFAKLNKIVVVEFSLGMGPRLWSFDKGGTKYSIKLLPFGGSCAMLGEDEDTEAPGTFSACGVLGRIAVVAAGPVFNFILAFVLALIVIGNVGIDRPTVLSVTKGSSAEAAGLQAGDTIVSYNGAAIRLGREIYLEEYLNPIGEGSIAVRYERNGEQYTAEIQPDLIERYLMGISYYKDGDASLSTVSGGGGAASAGLQAGDIVRKINGTEITSGADMEAYFSEHPLDGSEISIIYERDGVQAEAVVTPTYSSSYSSGFSYNLYREKTGFLETIQSGFYELRYEIVTVYKSLAMLVTGKVSANEVSGPVGIVDYIGETYEETKEEGAFVVFLNMMNLTIMLSANLGVMNLLPIPALDGGRLVFLIIEAIRRKPVPRDKEAMVHLAGFAILMVLMVVILFHDVWKLFQ